MKKILFISILIPSILTAQIDRSKAPNPAPAPELKIGQPATFVLDNGLKVFVVTNSKLPTVTATLSLDRDPIIEGNKAGMVSFAGTLMRRGTTKMKKAELDEQIDFLGASISSSATSVSVSSLSTNFSTAFELMSTVALSPSFEASELEKIRKQTLSGLETEKDDPEAISDKVENILLYGKDHPYGEFETEETIKNIQVQDVKNYYDAYWKPNIAYLVFVGDITLDQAKKLTGKYFAAWKKSEVPKTIVKPTVAPSKTYIAIVDRPASVQSIIKLVAPVQLKPGAPDVIPSSVMSNILGGGFSGRLFANLREKYGFTYGAYSGLSSDKFVGNFSASASVRNEKTDSSIQQFLHEFNRIKNESATEDEVSRMKNYLSGSFARSLERPSTIAGFALNIAVNNLPKNYYQDYLKNLAAVTVADVQNMAKKYVLDNNMHIVIVGNAKEISKGLEKYGEVKYFDIEGNETTAPVEKKIDESVTALSIIQKSIDALGTKEAMAAIKDISLNGDVSVMGQSLSVSQKFILPATYHSEIKMGPNVFQKELLVNNNYSVMQQGQVQEMDDAGKEDLNEKAAFFIESYWLSNGKYKFELKGLEQVDGKDAYNIAVTSPADKKYNMFYDVASGLAVKKSSEEETPMGKLKIQTYYQEYKKYNDVLIATKLIIDLGQFKQTITVTDLTINTGLKTEDFK